MEKTHMLYTQKLTLIFALAALLLCAPATTWADRGRDHGRGFRDRDIRHFHEHDVDVWRGGHWHHVRHNGRLGWWWVVGGLWYPYVRPIYPHPDPYVPPVVIVQQPPAMVQQPAPPPQTQSPAPTQYWYYCEQSNGYYPYVQDCPAGWKAVPAEPPVTAAPVPR
jgi:hypothetical protein